jgi:hypothetical protein
VQQKPAAKAGTKRKAQTSDSDSDSDSDGGVDLSSIASCVPDAFAKSFKSPAAKVAKAAATVNNMNAVDVLGSIMMKRQLAGGGAAAAAAVAAEREVGMEAKSPFSLFSSAAKRKLVSK